MKILFIYPDMISPDPEWQGYFYEGIAVLSAVARQAGHDTQLLHVARPMADEDVVKWVQENRDGDRTLVGFSCTANQFPHVKRWAPLIKAATGLPTIVGGVHPTLSPEDAFGADGIDMICRGDGEQPLIELCDRLDHGGGPEGVLGLWYTDENGEPQKQLMAKLTDLGGLPPPHWELYPTFDKLEYTRDGVGVHVGSRGCPYDCAYCCNRALIDMTKDSGKYMRFKPVPQFIAELKLYLERYPNTWAFVFEDDIFGVSRKWLKEFAEVYPKEIGLPFGCNMRPNLAKPEMVNRLKEAGCKRVNMAIEAGDDDVRNRILNRKLPRERLLEAFRLFREAGIEAKSYNIIGSPHETAANVLETVKINAEIAPEFMQHSIFFPYEGTPLHDMVYDEGLVATDREVTDYFRDTALDQDSIHRDQVLMFHQRFVPLVRHYQRIGKWPKPLRRVAEAVSDRFLVWSGAPRTLNALSRVGRVFRRPKTNGAAMQN